MYDSNIAIMITSRVDLHCMQRGLQFSEFRACKVALRILALCHQGAPELNCIIAKANMKGSWTQAREGIIKKTMGSYKPFE